MKQIIAVASGKGGVGKSTVATNLAVALANHKLPGEAAPRKVALIDVDFYGPSIPTLMGGTGDRVGVDDKERFIPANRYGVKYISIAFFLRNPDDPIIWRGPMLGKGITQLFQDVNWGEVDICVVDMPPGTGDAQISLSQLVNLTGAVLVTTPQEVALADVRRAINMFRKVNVPVLGVIENMAGFAAPDGKTYDIFGHGGGEALAKQYEIPFLGSIPIDIAIRQGGDQGEPIAVNSDTTSGKLFATLAENVIAQLHNAPVAPQLKVVN